MRGESKVYHKIQSDARPPLLAKGANCLDVLKGEPFAQTQVGIYTSKKHLRGQVNTQLST